MLLLSSSYNSRLHLLRAYRLGILLSTVVTLTRLIATLSLGLLSLFIDEGKEEQRG